MLRSPHAAWRNVRPAVRFPLCRKGALFRCRGTRTPPPSMLVWKRRLYPRTDTSGTARAGPRTPCTLPPLRIYNQNSVFPKGIAGKFRIRRIGCTGKGIPCGSNPGRIGAAAGPLRRGTHTRVPPRSNTGIPPCRKTANRSETSTPSASPKIKKDLFTRKRPFGEGRIRTFEAISSRFTVCPL